MRQYATSDFTASDVRLELYSYHATAQIDIDNLKVTVITLGTPPETSFLRFQTIFRVFP